MDREDTKRSGKMANTKDIFSQSGLTRRLFGSEDFRFFLFKKKWADTVGPILAEESYISGFRNDVLYVTVTNSPLMNHLFMMKREILRNLTKADEFGKRFQDIRFFTGRKEHKETGFAPLDELNRVMKETMIAPTAKITDKERDWIHRWTESHVKKEALRPEFADMMEQVLRRKKGKLAKGYHPCARCGDLCPPDHRFCSSCERQLNKTRKNRIVLLLKEQPHLNFQQVRALLPCSYEDYEESRDRLIHRLKERIFQKYGTDLEKRRLLALLLHRPLQEITAQEAADILKKMPEKKWD